MILKFSRSFEEMAFFQERIIVINNITLVYTIVYRMMYQTSHITEICVCVMFIEHCDEQFFLY